LKAFTMAWRVVACPGGSSSRPTPVGASLGDDLSAGGKLRKACFGLGEHAGQVLDLTAEFISLADGFAVAELEIRQEFGDVHAAAQRVSRQVEVGEVRRRAIFAAEAQQTCCSTESRDRMAAASRAGDGLRQAWRCGIEGAATRGFP